MFVPGGMQQSIRYFLIAIIFKRVWLQDAEVIAGEWVRDLEGRPRRGLRNHIVAIAPKTWNGMGH